MGETTRDFDYWVQAMDAAGYDYVYWPNREDPEVIGGVRRWRGDGLVDVVLFCDVDDGVVYRVRCGEGGNPFAPGIVLGHRIGTAHDVVRTAVQLPRPGVAGAPDLPEPMPELIAEAATPFVHGFYSTRYNTRHRPTATDPGVEDRAGIADAFPPFGRHVQAAS